MHIRLGIFNLYQPIEPDGFSKPSICEVNYEPFMDITVYKEFSFNEQKTACKVGGEIHSLKIENINAFDSIGFFWK